MEEIKSKKMANKLRQKIIGEKVQRKEDNHKKTIRVEARRVSLGLVLLLLWLLRFSAMWQDTLLLESHLGLSYVIEGKVIFSKQTVQGYEYHLSAIQIKKEDHSSFQKNHLTFLFYSPQEIKLDSIIKIKGKPASFLPAQNLGDWDAQKYYRAKNIYYRIKNAEIVEIIRHEKGYRSFLEDVKKKIEKQTAYLFPKQQQNLFLSLFLGEKYRLEKGVSEVYRKAGVSHILAVSGLHLALIVLGLEQLLKRLPLPYWLQYIILTGGVTGYLLLTGMQASTVRAAIMLIVLKASYFFDRAKDGKAALILSFLLMLFYNPFYIYDVGFILSYSTIASLIFLHPLLFEQKHKWIQLIGVTLTTQLMILPILSLYFHKFSLVAVLTNLWVVPVISFFLGTGIVALCLSRLSLVLGQVVAGCGYFLTEMTDIFLEWVTSWKWAELSVRAMTWWEILLFYAIVFLAWYLNKKKILWCLLFSIAIFLPYSAAPELSMLNVGQAESMVLQYQSHALVIDVGLPENRSTVNYLAYCGRQKVDMVLLSHLDKDHAGGLEYLLENCEVGAVGISKSYALLTEEMAVNLQLEKVYRSYQKLQALLKKKGIPLTYWQAGDEIAVADLTLKILYPSQEEIPLSANDFSFVGELTYGNTELLLTGDIGESVEKILLERHLTHPVTVLKVAHHGSKYSSSIDFLESVKPRLAIISCGRYNRYGHPSKEIVNRIKSFEAEVCSTAWDGQLFLRFTKRGEVIIDE